MSAPREYDRPAGGDLSRLRELLDVEITDAVWGEIIRGLVDAAANGEKGAVQAAKLLFAYAFGVPGGKNDVDEAPPIHIRTIEVRPSEPKAAGRDHSRRARRGAERNPAPGTMEGMDD